MVEDKLKSTENFSKPQLTTYKLKNKEFVLPSYYVPVDVIGSGAYGTVISAIDTRTKKKVAIKKVLNVFGRNEEFQKRILREVLILKHFRGHENVVEFKDLVVPVSYEKFQDVYLVTSLMDFDLKGIIRSEQELYSENVQYFLYQMFRGLKYLHSAGVLHRDIKPSNILLNSEMDVSLCDFGLSRGVDFETDPSMSTSYVATRWYRAPELLLMWEKTSRALDLWSIGCIFAEMLMPPNHRKPLFPGNHYLDQLNKILHVCGTPSMDTVKACEKGKKYLRSLPQIPKKNLKELFPKASDDAVDLLEKLLKFDPEERITVDEALKHPFLKDLHDPDDEPTCKPFNFRFGDNFKKESIKKMIYDTIIEWNKTENGVCGDAEMAEGVVTL